MNFYMLVEGKSTEMKVYPRLIEKSHPEYVLVNDLEDISQNSYFMFSGHGMPALYDAIRPALEDIREFNENHIEKITQFVICLDTDYYGNEEETYYRIMQEIQKNSIDDVDVSIILQTMCIETWFLGNQDAFPEKYGPDFGKYAEYYNVSVDDPEKMSKPEESPSIGSYSKSYLKKMMNESGKTYSVSRVKDVTTPAYIGGMEKRLHDTGHIQSYRYLQEFLKKL